MHDTPPSSPRSGRRKLELHWQILLGLVIGLTCGLIANVYFSRVVASDPAVYDVSGKTEKGPDGKPREIGNGTADTLDRITAVTEPLGKIFLRLVMMVVIPLVFSALALGVMGLGDAAHVGKIGLRTLVYTLILSSTSVFVGVGLANLLRPGDALSETDRDALKSQYAADADGALTNAKKAKPLGKMLLDIIPENPIQEMTGALDGSSPGNGMLSVMFFALACGVALHGVAPERREVLLKIFEGLLDLAMVIVGFAMRLAPYGVALLFFSIVSRMGGGLLVTLAWFVFTVFLGYAVQLLLVYSLLLWLIAKKNPLTFFREISEAMLTAFGTSSSNATLPTALRVAEQDLKLPPSVSRFVLTIGATGNQNGTALFEGMVVLFLAQVFGVKLELEQQILVVMMAILAGVGTAGVPGGSLPLIVILLNSVGVPPEGIAIVLGVDRFLDMGRTVLNVTGDLCLATCVAAGESPAEVAAMAAAEAEAGMTPLTDASEAAPQGVSDPGDRPAGPV